MKINFQDSGTKMRKAASSLQAYLERLNEVHELNNYEAAESSINLPFDEMLLKEVENLAAKKVTSKLRYIFVVGIGGSNLGTKAVYDALYGYRDLLQENRPQMIFVDTNNTTLLNFYSKNLIPSLASEEEYLLITISKSGGTTETIVNTEILLDALRERFGAIEERTVVITDEGSAFWLGAEKAQIARLSIPKMVGGRYSVFSAVGLFPLLVLGFDIKAFRQGAEDMLRHCISADYSENQALLSASFLYLAYLEGKTINDNFIFNSELESLGKWYRQLLGESIGKEYNLVGEKVAAGITPTVSIGSTDLHSVAQLYLGGPKDKVTTFIYSRPDKDIDIPNNRVFDKIADMIDGKTTNNIMEAILGGTKIAYKNNHLPFMEVELEGVTPYELGAFMQFKMIEVMYLGKLLELNPFDQPNVESYKVETKRLLQE